MRCIDPQPVKKVRWRPTFFDRLTAAPGHGAAVCCYITGFVSKLRQSIWTVTDGSIGKSYQREILSQMKVWKTQEYFVYFAFFKLHSWGKISAEGRRQFGRRLHTDGWLAY